jgi:glutamine amidotransferase
MQMLFEESEEFGTHAGLGFLRGRVRRFEEGRTRIPHVGWNRVSQPKGHPLWKGIEDRSFFYFVHSYYCAPVNADDVIGETEYAATYASAVGRGSLCGVQFHPEKSQAAGLRVLGNFAESDFSSM